jgi:hypothetical protein
METAKELAAIAENAEAYVMKEGGGDWFDGVTIKRNMGELKKYVAEFAKVAKEAQSMNQRLTGLYEDSGRVLSRYFEIAEGIEGGGDMATEVPDEREKQLGRVKQPSLKMEDGRVVELRRVTEQLKKRKSQMSRMTIEEQQAAHQLNEQDRKRIAVLKEQITDEMPTGDWTKLSVPKMKYANALEFEKFLRGEGFKILRKDYMDRNTETKFSEFYAPLPEWNEANAVAVKGYKDYDIEAPTKKNGVVHY